MATYLALITETQRGEEQIRETVARAKEFQEMAASCGVEVKGLYWTFGAHDGALLLDAPDDATVAGLLYKLTSQGNVRTETMRAFDIEEMQAILS